ncbi:BZ3500_MvSof-1268-A1-R1_Chr9g10546 [Microbotryum saponariae]|uniref:BZ3500_MvSof-1268-A1-R1_Chr9g10546 protein n=1 Tax=Microbotryum saponariae TaxID=289078 RepID=A0A2X0MCW8_9BASI|nr:BZ3501_MvSof-1269-A2-R1_Chr9g10295 [Microbotryum saponariae]SDA00273.1 BZ3500_MvSof-1268-A1-R1_Chr9g10546 [Microbotryum saponariae]
MAPTHIFHPLANPGPAEGHDNGLALTALFRESGPGTTILLLPATTYPLYSTVDFIHPRTTLATLGYPEFQTGQQAVLETRSEKEAGAINMYNKAETSLKRVHLRGCRGWGRGVPTDEEKEKWKKEGRLGWIEGGGAMVWMGGPDSHDSIVEGCRLEDPRGWTAVHLCDWALRAKLLNNIVGPCGQEAPAGPWADGLSVAGKDSVVSGNTIIDATDGAIVVFCAPGSTISDNTIIARTRDLLGAINMVDDFPYNRDFSNTRVVGNTIRTEGAYIRLAIGCGPTCWSPWQTFHQINYGGYVQNNYLGPGRMGYGVALSGTKDWTVLGNVVLPDTKFVGDVAKASGNAPPCSFLVQWEDRERTINSDLQDGFLHGEAVYLIGIEDGASEFYKFEGGQVRLDAEGVSAMGEGGIVVKGGRLELQPGGELVIRKTTEGHEHEGKVGHGAVLWSSGAPSSPHHDPVLSFDLDGVFSVRGEGGHGDVVWNPTSYLQAHLDRLASLPPLKTKPARATPADPNVPDPNKWAGHPSFVLRGHQPFLQVRTKDDNVLFSTSYEYETTENWSMQDGKWIAVAPPHLRGVQPSSDAASASEGTCAGPPAIPPRPEQTSTAHGHHPFRAFVKDLASDLVQATHSGSNPNVHPAGRPAIPPRPDAITLTKPDGPVKPLFLFLNPVTAQLTLHSSSSPAHPEPEHIHWVAPQNPVEGGIDMCWVGFQYDGNLVIYAKRGEDVSVPWASGTNADKMVLRGHGDPNGPALELLDKQGMMIWTSRS